MSACFAKYRYRRFACDSPAKASLRLSWVLVPLRLAIAVSFCDRNREKTVTGRISRSIGILRRERARDDARVAQRAALVARHAELREHGLGVGAELARREPDARG